MGPQGRQFVSSRVIHDADENKEFSGFQTNHHFQYNYKHHKRPLIFVKLTFQLLASSRYRIYQHKCIQRGLQYLGVLQPTFLKNYILRRRRARFKHLNLFMVLLWWFWTKFRNIQEQHWTEKKGSRTSQSSTFYKKGII